MDKATKQLQSLLSLDVSGVVAAYKTEDGWHVTIEMIERKAIPDTQDFLGMYDVYLDQEANITSYERRSIRERADLEESVA